MYIPTRHGFLYQLRRRYYRGCKVLSALRAERAGSKLKPTGLILLTGSHGGCAIPLLGTLPFPYFEGKTTITNRAGSLDFRLRYLLV
jgi:hypothetical protein